MALWSEEQPSEDFHRVLAPDGTLVGDPPDLDDDALKELYWAMKLTRAFEDRALRLQRSGELSIISRCRGEEATPLGAAAALSPATGVSRCTDSAPGSSTGASRSTGSCSQPDGRGTRDHRRAPPDGRRQGTAGELLAGLRALGANLPNTVGSALADKLNDRDTVSLTFVGDGSTSQGDFHDALNFAGVFEVPAVFICQNNQWAISVPAHRQTASETFAQKGDAYGVPTSASTATTSSRCTRRPGTQSSAPATAAARRSSSASPTASSNTTPRTNRASTGTRNSATTG